MKDTKIRITESELREVIKQAVNEAINKRSIINGNDIEVDPNI